MKHRRIKAPKTLDVGPTRYRVDTKKGLKSLGQFQTHEGFLLDAGMPKDMEAEVLFHELLHSIFYTFNMYKWIPRAKDEERLVSEMSTGICTVFRQNPKLLSYLKENLR